MSTRKNIAVLGQIYEDLADDSVPLHIVFVDLCGSTEYKQLLIEQDLPHSIWLHRQLIFLQTVYKHVTAHGGTVVKTIGDEVMCTFDYSQPGEEIVHTLVELHCILAKLIAWTGKAKMRAKISLDYGETINCSLAKDTYDPLGLCVDRCARLNKEAGPDEIVFSAEFNQRLHKKDKVGIHQAIKEVQKHSTELRGIGIVGYYRVTQQ